MDQQYELTIGLEIHMQISTEAKLFSSSPTTFGEEPNCNVSPFDAAMPGMLPMLNKEAVQKAIKAGIIFNCEINKNSYFERKHYFYPDLPSGYQISQLEEPICKSGFVEIQTPKGTKKVRINRMQLEQDAGKSVHDISSSKTCIDLNRAGIPLLEIVTEPDMSSVEEAVAFVKKIRENSRYANISNADMEKGEFRCDINVSIKKPNSKTLGTRSEIKNLNSIQSLSKAIEYEYNLQISTLNSGKKIKQETKLFDINTNVTKTLREKTDANIYLYMRDPDLMCIDVADEDIAEATKSIPELPDQKMHRYTQDLKINLQVAESIISHKDRADFFEEIMSQAKKCPPFYAANWITTEIFSRENKGEIKIKELNTKHIADLVEMIADETISKKISQKVLNELIKEKKSPQQIIEKLGLIQISDTSYLTQIVEKIIEENKEKVEEYRSGKTKLLQFFVGQIMKETQGKANPSVVNNILQKALAQ